jgi:phosphatidylserine decarboxylase
MSQLNSRKWVLKEGYPFIAPPLLIGVLGFGIGWGLVGMIGLLVAFAVALFFRNPRRRSVSRKGVAVAPADGRVVEASHVHGDQGSGPLTKVSIFMSVFNVHVNRSPVKGEVVELRHDPGSFRPAYRHETSVQNERNLVRIRMDDGREVDCVQVAGVLARRIVCWVRRGTNLTMGAPFGMIRFGSRVDCYFPAGFDVDVRIGQRVWGGETILGYFGDVSSGEMGGTELAGLDARSMAAGNSTKKENP